MKTGLQFIQQLREAELPGERAHEVYSPPYRPLYTYEEILQFNPRFAAVNILLYWKNSEWYFPLMLRTENEKDKHSGQISLPGGSVEENDRDFEHTAIRETAEEIGITENKVRIIRDLTPIYIPPSNFYVRPYVSFTGKNPFFFLQESEALELIEFPVTTLLELSENPKTMVFPSSRNIEVPFIEFGGYTIWGATSMILSEFSRLLKKM